MSVLNVDFLVGTCVGGTVVFLVMCFAILRSVTIKDRKKGDNDRWA